MKLVPITEIFDICYGNQFDVSKMEILEGEGESINFISRNSNNNGVVAHVDVFNDVEPFPVGLITVTLGGSYLLSSFVQTTPFYTAQNIKVLTPKIPLTQQEKLYYCTCIEANRFRYSSHAREANSTFNFLRIPAYESVPNSVKNFQIEDVLKKDAVVQKSFSLNIERWKGFRYDEIFDICTGKGPMTMQEVDDWKGDTPFISTISGNNGRMITYGGVPQHLANAITVSNDGSIGSTFYQPSNFSASYKVNVLKLKTFQLNKYVAMFLVTIIEKEKYRYAYGRKFGLDRMNQSLIKLPITSSGTPDWQFMEEYIKSLPYSCNL